MLQWAWSLKVWTEIFSKPHYWTVLWHTLWMSALCVALCILIALPVAYALATRLQAARAHVNMLITFAFLTDVTLKTFGWVLFLEEKGAANFLLENDRAFRRRCISFLFTDWATMLGMVYNLLPSRSSRSISRSSDIDRSLILAAYDAGRQQVARVLGSDPAACRPGIWAGRCWCSCWRSACSSSRRCWAAANRR